MEEAKERIIMLQKFIKEIMIEGQDYGLIAGCSKPSLLKSGAEKLCDIYGFSKQVEITNRLEDWDKGIFSYEVRVTLINKRTGIIESQGIGSANSREKKFKTQDCYTLVNTLLKMAKKRALVDAVLSATRSSGLFTQDIEDLDIVLGQESKVSSISQSKKPLTETVTSVENSKPASESQLKLIGKLIAEKGISAQVGRGILNEKYGIQESRQLSSTQASDFIKHLMNLANKAS
jgi:hypothetical protein